MNQNRRNLLIGVLLGLLIAVIVFYLQDEIIANLSAFLISFLLCLAIVVSLLAFVVVWNREKMLNTLFGKRESTEAKPGDAFKDTLGLVAKKYIPNATKQQLQSSTRFLQTFLWGRMVYIFLGVLVSIFIALGGILGSILLFKQNQLLEVQTEKIVEQTDLLGKQNDKFTLQNHAT